MATVGQGMYALPNEDSEQSPDSISTCIFKQGLSYVAVVVFACLVVVNRSYAIFFRESNMISVSLEFMLLL